MTNLSSTVQVIDPAQAKLWLEKKYKGQRQLDWNHVKDLARAMSEGKFGLAFIAFASLNGELHLVNGQHTLHAIILSGKPQTLPVSYAPVETEEEEAELYYHTDRNKKRTLADSLRVTDLANKLNLTKTQTNYTASALRFIKDGFGNRKLKNKYVSDDDIVEWLPLWAWECRQVYRAILPSRDWERNMIVKQSVFSVALVTMRFKHTQALKFWEGVAKGNDLARHDPRQTLRDWLVQTTNQSIHVGKRIRGNEMARGVAVAWNAYMDSKQIRSIRVPDPNAKIVISGTDYSGIQQEDYLPLYRGEHQEE